MSNTLKFGNGLWATKEGSTLAYNDENGNFKPLPFDFTRASSATRVNQQGLIETVASGVPRIDYTDANGALKLEPQRTNLVTYSEDFSNAYWNKSDSSITSNAAISPDGALNADKLVENTSTTSHHLYGNIAAAVGVYTFSVFVKKGEREYVYLYSDAVGKGKSFNLANGTIDADIIAAPTSAKIDDYGNGWYRCSMTITANSGAFRIGNCLANGNFSYQGDGTSGVYIYGAQLEQGSYATSYIPTSGQSGGVTRVAEVCNNGGNDQVINSTEGVLYFEGSAIANDGTFKRISVGTSDNLFENSIQLRYNAIDNSITYQFRVGNVYQADLTITTNTTNVNKIACVWKINRFEIWVNGVKEAQDTSGSVPTLNTFDSLFFGKVSASLTEPFYGNVKDVRLYNTALTDSELIALTS